MVSQTPSGQSLDTGAVRIDYPGATPVTISAFNVTFGGGQSSSIWNPLTIGPGQIGIFTQTASYNFDSSDFGAFSTSPVNVGATHPLGGCTDPANVTEVAACKAYQPIVSFDAGSGMVHPADSGHVSTRWLRSHQPSSSWRDRGEIDQLERDWQRSFARWKHHTRACQRSSYCDRCRPAVPCGTTRFCKELRTNSF